MPQHMAKKPIAWIDLDTMPQGSNKRPRPFFSSPLKRTCLGCLIGSALILILQVRAQGSITALLSVAFYSFLVSLNILWAVYWIGGAKNPNTFSWKPIEYMVLGSIAGGIALEGGTLFGSPFHSPLIIQDWSVKQTLLWTCITFFIITLVLTLRKLHIYNTSVIKKTFFNVVIPSGIASVGAAALCSFFLQQVLNIAFAYLFSFFVFAFMVIILLVVCYQKNADAEWFFLVVALCVGLSMSFLLPRQTYVSWDDETHYDYTVAVSYLINPAYDQADIMLAANHVALGLSLPQDTIKDSIPSTEIEANEQSVDELDNKNAIEVPGFQTVKLKSSLRYDVIAYAPTAAGLWLGRLFHLSTSACILFSRITSVLFYAAIGFLAIHLIPVKKILMASVALLPTALFLTTSFSTDSFIISMSLLSISLIIKQAISPTGRSWWHFIAIFVTMLLACAPKAVYFPLICLVFLIPARNYPSKKAYQWILRGLIALVALVFLGLIAMALTTHGDARGGSDVDLQKQLSYILSNPIKYGIVLLNFLFTQYLNPATSYGYSLFFAYMGEYTQISSFFAALIPIILLTIACMDSNRTSQSLANWKSRFLAFAVFLITVVFIATSLYLAFTPVGSDTVLGCQPRYLLPLIFPAIAFCFNWRLSNNMHNRTFACACTALMAALGFIGLWFLVLPMGL